MSETNSRNWSEQQVAIFRFFASGRGNLVVRARAGTGKTTTIVEALRHRPRHQKALLAAFNKRIAQELQARLPDSNAEAKTLHSLGFKFVARAWQGIQLDATVDTDRAVAACGQDAPGEIIACVKKLAGLLKNVSPFGNEKDAADLAIDFECAPGAEWEKEGWTLAAVARCAVQAREAARTRDRAGRISFDDMIFIPIANDFARAWFDLVVIDEAQDMNAAQLLLAQAVCRPSGRIVVVGDDRQAIYGFRGADAGGIDRLKVELEAAEMGLTVTYRCGVKIVEEAAKLVPDYAAAPGAHEGTIDAISKSALVEAARPGDFILSRKNAPLMPICLSFLRAGVRARVEGRDVAEGLKALIRRLRARSIEELGQKLDAWKSQQMTRLPADEDRAAEKATQVNDQAETIMALADGCADVPELVARLDSIFMDVDPRTAATTVVCSSIHKAKGLEADRVFVLQSTVSTRGTENANLYYVAVTRARRHLTWVTGKVA